MSAWLSRFAPSLNRSKRRPQTYRRALSAGRLDVEPLEERALLAVFHVALTGDDATPDGTDPNTPFRSIQAAIIAAASGSGDDDEIRVQGGLYDEDGVDAALFIPNSANIQNLTIRGGYLAGFAEPDGSNPTVYVAQGGGDFLTIGDDDATIENISFHQNGTAVVDNGIVIEASNVTLRNLTIEDANFGVAATGVSNLSVETVASLNNTAGFVFENIGTSLIFVDSTATDNLADGIYVEGADAISLTNTSSINNGSNGLTILDVTGLVEIQGGLFSDNILGIYIANSDSVSVTGTSANSNLLDGLRLKNIQNQISIEGGTYNENGFVGVRVNGEAGGGVQLTDVVANLNTSLGVVVSDVQGNVVITNGEFNLNNGGIAVDSVAALLVDGASASDNTNGDGLLATNVTDVEVLSGTYLANAGSGVRILNSTNASLDNVVAGANSVGLTAENVETLADLNGDYSANLSSGVRLQNITGTATFTGTIASTTGGSGIEADGVNSLELNNATLNDNAQSGVKAENVGDLSVIDGQMNGNLVGIEFLTSGSLLVDGAATQNNETGILVNGASAIELVDVTATGNLAFGLNASNVAGHIAIEGGTYSNNFLGAFINGAGTLTLNGVTASNNTNLEGVRADNVSGHVEINAGMFQQNQLFGIRVQGAGSLTVTGATVTDNSGIGLVASNITGDVLVDGGLFNENAGGIAVDTASSATIQDVTVNGNNSNSGVLLLNVSGTATVDGGLFGGNAGYGVFVENSGSAVLNGASLQSNALGGFRILDTGSATLTDLEMLNNVTGNGGELVNTPDVTFNTTTTGDVIDEVIVRNDQIEFNRGGDVQQPILYSDVDVLAINTFDGDDDITIDLDPLAGLPPTFNIDMGPEPTADTLRLIGINGLTIDDDGFTLLVDGGPTINYLDVENLDLGQPAAPLSRDSIGLFDPAVAGWFLKNHNSAGFADALFLFGDGGSDLIPLAGDWNGDDIDTIGYYSPSTGTFFLKNSNSAGTADLVFQFGPSGNGLKPVVGDWNGDGTDTIGLYDGSTFFLRNSNSSGDADIIVQFGAMATNFTPLAGDWDGNGTDTIGLYDGSYFFLRNSNTPGAADITLQYGELNGNFQVVVGDWDNNGTDTLGIYNGESFFLRNVHEPGPADITFGYGAPNQGYVAIAGDWDGLSDAQALQLAGEPIENSTAAALTYEALAPIVELAIAQWEAAGIDASLVEALRSIDVQISSLSGALLGLASSTGIQIDVNAAGLGWYVDADEAGLGADEVDLFTVVAHELGHMLGLADLPASSDSVMSGFLSAGVRRAPTAADVDALFANNAWEDEELFDLVG